MKPGLILAAGALALAAPAAAEITPLPRSDNGPRLVCVDARHGDAALRHTGHAPALSIEVRPGYAYVVYVADDGRWSFVAVTGTGIMCQLETGHGFRVLRDEVTP